LTVQDPVTGLFPAYQLAACCTVMNSHSSSPSSTVSTVTTATTATTVLDSNPSLFEETNVVYRLLRTCPDVVTYYRSQSANTSTNANASTSSTNDAVMVH
jgi:hypothetical protein